MMVKRWSSYVVQLQNHVKKNPVLTESAFWGICDCSQLIFWLLKLVSNCGILVKRSGKQFSVSKRDKRYPCQCCGISNAKRATESSRTFVKLLRNVTIRQYFVFAAPVLKFLSFCVFAFQFVGKCILQVFHPGIYLYSFCFLHTWGYHP